MTDQMREFMAFYGRVKEVMGKCGIAPRLVPVFRAWLWHTGSEGELLARLLVNDDYSRRKTV
jgi:hypothetical protein